MKHHVTKDKLLVESLQAIESKANHVPSPPSRLLGTTWTNVCPVCGLPCSSYPWSCTCGWTAAASPDGCCTADHEILVAGDDYAYPVDADYSDSDLSGADKAAWAQAKATAVEHDPKEKVR